MGDLITVLLQISSRLQYWKNFENRSVLDEVMPKILLVPFFPDMVYKLISLMNVIKYFGGGAILKSKIAVTKDGSGSILMQSVSGSVIRGSLGQRCVHQGPFQHVSGW